MIRFRHTPPMHEQLHCDLSKARTAARTDDPGLSVKRDRGSKKRTAPVSSTVPTAVAASAAKKTGKIVFRFTALSAVRLGVAFLMFLAMTLALAGTTNGSASGEITKQLPANVDLRPKFAVLGLGPRDQGERPTCSVFTMTVALEFANATSSQRGERLSVEYLNWAANQTRRNPRDGGFFSDMWNGFAKHGICSEEQMPYQTKFASENAPDAAATASAKARCALGLQLHWIKRWNVKTGLKEEEFNAVKNTLNLGWPVCGGFRWPNKEQWKKDTLQMCPANAVFDGHSILLVGYQDDRAQAGGGVFIFRNTNRGRRDGYMPYEYAKAYMNDALWINPPDNPNAGAANSTPSKVATQ